MMSWAFLFALVSLLVASVGATAPAVVASSGPYRLLEAGDYTHAKAIASCSMHGWFAGAVTTSDELEFIWELMSNATADRTWSGVRRTAEFRYEIAAGPNTNQLYSTGRRSGGGRGNFSCAQEQCNWDRFDPNGDGHDLLINKDGTAWDVTHMAAWTTHVLCQTCVAGSTNCSFPLPTAPKPTVIAASGDFLLTVPLRVPPTVAQRICEQFGGSLGYYTTDLEAASVLALKSRMTAAGVVIDGMKDAAGVMRWQYGPLAGKAISKGVNGTDFECLQEKCFYGRSEPNDYDGFEPKLVLDRGVHYDWNDGLSVFSLSEEYHVLCRKPTSTWSPDVPPAIPVLSTPAPQPSNSFSRAGATPSDSNMTTVIGVGVVLLVLLFIAGILIGFFVIPRKQHGARSDSFTPFIPADTNPTEMLPRERFQGEMVVRPVSGALETL